jgi:hypothetical protein
MSTTIKLLLESHKQQTEINENDLNKVVHANATNDEMEKLRKLNELLNKPPSRNSLHAISEFLLTEDEVASGVDYVGNIISEWSWLMYIQDYIGLDVCTYVPEGIIMTYDRSLQQLTVSDRFIRDITECLEEDPSFIIGTLTIHIPLTNTGHSNGLIFNVKERSVVRFEPQADEYASGNFGIIQELLDEMVPKLLIQIHESDKKFGSWTYIKPTDICPNLGPQARELLVEYDRTIDRAGGFCQAWSSLYILLRVTNPDKTDKQIINDLLKNDNKTLLSMIRRFAGFVQTLVEDNNDKIRMIQDDVYNPEQFNKAYTISTGEDADREIARIKEQEQYDNDHGSGHRKLTTKLFAIYNNISEYLKELKGSEGIINVVTKSGKNSNRLITVNTKLTRIQLNKSDGLFDDVMDIITSYDDGDFVKKVDVETSTKLVNKKHSVVIQVLHKPPNHRDNSITIEFYHKK